MYHYFRAILLQDFIFLQKITSMYCYFRGILLLIKKPQCIIISGKRYMGDEQ
jgi:hypothetical protein